MKLKNLLLTFIALAFSTLAMAQGYNHDVIDYSWVTFNGSQSRGAYLVQDTKVAYGSYTVYVDENDPAGTMKFVASKSGIAVTKSAGYARELTITWHGDNSEKSIKIYGYTTAPSKPSSEFRNPTGKELGTIDYPSTSYSISEDYEYILIIGIGAPVINSVDFAWQTISTFNVTTDFDPEYGDIKVSPAKAVTGATVTATFSGIDDFFPTELTGYKIYKTGDPTTVVKEATLSEAEYTMNPKKVTFKMPSYNVTVTATFQDTPNREENFATVTGKNVSNKNISLISGDNVTFTVTTDNPSQDLVATIGNNSKVRMENFNYNAANHQATFTLNAYDQGETSITFTTTQSNSYLSTKTTYTINVSPREVMLVSQATDGNYYAVANSLTEGMMQAVPVMKNGEDFMLLNGGNKNDLKWLVCTIYDAERTQYTIQSGTATSSTKKYLQFTDADIDFARFGNTAFTWYKQGIGFMTKKTEISWSSEDGMYTARTYNKDVEGAYEVDFSKLNAGSEVTLRSGLTIDAFSTTCQPYSFIAAEGVELYEIDNIQNKHIYFCRLDAGEITTAGQPYIIKSNSAEAKAYKIGDEGAEAGTHNGLYGVYGNTTWNTLWTTQPSLFYNGNVMVFKKDGSIAHVEYDTTRGGGGGIAGHSACILLSEVNHGSSTCSPADSGAAPRRVALAVEESQVPTAVENTLNAANINWNEPVYNLMGQRVARGTTGVLIQNGKKFIAE